MEMEKISFFLKMLFRPLQMFLAYVFLVENLLILTPPQPPLVENSTFFLFLKPSLNYTAIVSYYNIVQYALHASCIAFIVQASYSDPLLRKNFLCQTG